MDKDVLRSFMTRFPCKLLKNGNYRTTIARLSYPHLFKPQPALEEGGDPKYNCNLLFPLGADLELLFDAAKATAIERWGDKAKTMKLAMPFKKQDEKRRDDGTLPDEYTPGALLIVPTSTNAPKIVGPNLSPITSERDIKAGDWVLATIRPFAYDKGVKKGVSFGLQNIQKICDGEPLGGGYSDPAEEFEVIDGSTNPADVFAEANGRAGDGWDFG
jgi:hypothetical protein